MAMFDNHHHATVAMAPTFVPAVIAMFTEFGARAVIVAVAMFDHDGFSTGN